MSEETKSWHTEDFDRLKYLCLLLSNLNQLGHFDTCGANDGAGCGCHYYDALLYCKNRIKEIEEKYED